MALVNAYVHTPLAVALFKAEDQLLDEHNYRRPVYIAHVNGGVARVSKTKAVDTAESSPYFGLNACAWWARRYGHDRVLALDVGGTTAKLGVIADGKPMTVEHGDLLGVPLKTPWTLLRSEAVGGGSIARAVDGERQARPGVPGRLSRARPVTTSAAREATLTDAFVAAGMLNPERFLGGRRALRVDLAQRGARRRSSRRARDRQGRRHGRRGRARDARARRRRGELRALLLRRQRRQLRRAGGRSAGPRSRVRVRARPGAERVRVQRRRDLPRLRGVGPTPHDAIVARGKEQVRRDLAGEERRPRSRSRSPTA